MFLDYYLPAPGEKPLDRFVPDGGFASIFRTIGCIGDSLSSGEFESTKEDGTKGYHDFFEYSWGQFIARQIGAKVYNFSRGGMTAKEYWERFAEANDFWNPDKLCQAYIIALGVNDLNHIDIGSIADINKEDYNQNANTFAGYYARIIQRLKSMQPKARFFLVTMPKSEFPAGIVRAKAHSELMNQLAEFFDYTYVIDLYRYAPIYDREFRERFNLGGHMNPMGYKFTADMVTSYIDFIIRSDMESFKQVGFIGTPYHNNTAKW